MNDAAAFVSLSLKVFAALSAASQERLPSTTAATADTSDKKDASYDSSAADALCGGWLPALRFWVDACMFLCCFQMVFNECLH